MSNTKTSSKMLITFITVVIFEKINCTIDMNLGEFNYLADHLLDEECRRLVTDLHWRLYNKPNTLEERERRMPENIPCLRQLLHWNSVKGEGVGQTHEEVVRSLLHIGRADLAHWLGKTVFRQLGQQLQRDLQQPFQQFLQDTSQSPMLIKPTEELETVNDWSPMDTVCLVLIILLSSGTFIVVFFMIFLNYRKMKRSSNKKKKFNYSEIEQIVSESDNEG